MKKVDFRTLSSEERYAFRKRAITLIKSGEKQKTIAQLFGVRTGKSLLKKKYYLSGVNELFVQKNGRFKMHSKILPGLY